CLAATDTGLARSWFPLFLYAPAECRYGRTNPPLNASVSLRACAAKRSLSDRTGRYSDVWSSRFPLSLRCTRAPRLPTRAQASARRQINLEALLEPSPRNLQPSRCKQLPTHRPAPRFLR